MVFTEPLLPNQCLPSHPASSFPCSSQNPRDSPAQGTKWIMTPGTNVVQLTWDGRGPRAPGGSGVGLRGAESCGGLWGVPGPHGQCEVPTATHRYPQRAWGVWGGGQQTHRDNVRDCGGGDKHPETVWGVWGGGCETPRECEGLWGGW